MEKEMAEGRTVIMVGDGINDSLALSAADTGIAIKGGAAIAWEIADITFSAEDLQELVTLKKSPQLCSTGSRRITGLFWDATVRYHTECNNA